MGSLFKGRKVLPHSIERQRSLDIRQRTAPKDSLRCNWRLLCLPGAFIQSHGGVRQAVEEFVLRPLKRDPTVLLGRNHNENYWNNAVNFDFLRYQNLEASLQLECWNTGIMGFGELTEWVIGKIKLTNHNRNEKFGSNPFGKRRIYIIPLFHHSIIPCVRQDDQASININNFNKL